MPKELLEPEHENQDETSGPPLSVEEKIDIIAKVIFDIYDLLKQKGMN